MSLLDKLADESVWESFYEYKMGLAVPKNFTAELRKFIDEKRYLPVCSEISGGAQFPLPTKSIISKMSSTKKRIVYTYPNDENTVLKLLTYLLLRKYNNLFCNNLYSFRPGKTAKDAIRRLMRVKNLSKMYSYKVDVSDYFNSVSVNKLLPMLESAFSDDERLYVFLSSLLCEPNVIENGQVHTEQKGIMAGTPVATFYANLYLSELDRYFYDNGVLYARYSDDIILFAPTCEECMSHAEKVRTFLADHALSVNPKKECFASPDEGFTFLGFSLCGNVIDIAPATVRKLKNKMRRKRDSLARWKKRNEADGDRAARAFIRIFNRKLFENVADNELTWSNWFFPSINTTVSLHEIDLYAQDCARYLISGKHTKARFNVRYEDLKELGYRSLVHEYYNRVNRDQSHCGR